MTTTTLYRFYDKAGLLLYVGIAGNPGRRFHQHAKEKAWWADVARSTMEHFTTREEAAAAEVAAIVSERPRYNVAHAGRCAAPALPNDYRCDTDCLGSGRYRYYTRWGQCRHVNSITLMPELHLSPCVDEIYGEWDDEAHRGKEEVWYWMRRVISDAGGHPPFQISIYWGVETDHTFETAPFGHLWDNPHPDLGDFLDHFSQPVDCQTGSFVNFLRLPIAHRFPHFAEALGWQPSPLAPFCPFFHLYDHTMSHSRNYEGEPAGRRSSLVMGNL